MACSTCRSTNTTCGCKDLPLTTAPVYTCPPDIKCPDPTPCYETIQDTCVKHGNYSIIEFGYLFADGVVYSELPAGASLEQAYQAMSVRFLDTSCLPPTNVHPSYIGTTAIIISWENTGADTYTLAYGTTSSLGTTVTGITSNSYTLTNLNSSTNYYFQITTDCGPTTGSQGAVIKVTTLGVL